MGSPALEGNLTTSIKKTKPRISISRFSSKRHTYPLSHRDTVTPAIEGLPGSVPALSVGMQQ